MEEFGKRRLSAAVSLARCRSMQPKLCCPACLALSLFSQGKVVGRTSGGIASGAAPKPAERQLPPVPRFDEQRSSAAAAASATNRPADVVTTAAPSRQPLAVLPTASSRRAAAAVPPAAARPPLPVGVPAGRQQVVLQACGAATRGAAQEEAGEEDETAPVVMSKLAQRVQRGRQSLAPSKVT